MRILSTAIVILGGMIGIAHAQQPAPLTQQELADAWNACENLPPVMVEPTTGRIDMPTRLRTKKTWPGHDYCQAIDDEFKAQQSAAAKDARMAKAKAVADKLKGKAQ